MTKGKPKLTNLQDIPKTQKVEVQICKKCEKAVERKAGRVFICFFCGGTEAK